jgi:hypothetical protein
MGCRARPAQLDSPEGGNAPHHHPNQAGRWAVHSHLYGFAVKTLHSLGITLWTEWANTKQRWGQRCTTRRPTTDCRLMSTGWSSFVHRAAGLRHADRPAPMTVIHIVPSPYYEDEINH